jgi:hypothetical protein
MWAHVTKFLPIRETFDLISLFFQPLTGSSACSHFPMFSNTRFLAPICSPVSAGVRCSWCVMFCVFLVAQAPEGISVSAKPLPFRWITAPVGAGDKTR